MKANHSRSCNDSSYQMREKETQVLFGISASLRGAPSAVGKTPNLCHSESALVAQNEHCSSTFLI